MINFLPGDMVKINKRMFDEFLILDVVDPSLRLHAEQKNLALIAQIDNLYTYNVLRKNEVGVVIFVSDKNSGTCMIVGPSGVGWTHMCFLHSVFQKEENILMFKNRKINI